MQRQSLALWLCSNMQISSDLTCALAHMQRKERECVCMCVWGRKRRKVCATHTERQVLKVTPCENAVAVFTVTQQSAGDKWSEADSRMATTTKTKKEREREWERTYFVCQPPASPYPSLSFLKRAVWWVCDVGAWNSVCVCVGMCVRVWAQSSEGWNAASALLCRICTQQQWDGPTIKLWSFPSSFPNHLPKKKWIT